MLKQITRFAMAAAALMASNLVNANLITTTGNLTAGDIDYVTFDVTDAGNFTLTLTSSAFDTELFLFGGSLSTGNLLAANDDIFFLVNLNSSIDRFLSIGHYIAAIGAYNTTTNEAVSGTNPGNTYFGAWTLNIDSRNGISTTQAHAVPEPGSIALLGAGLVALGLMRRRTRAN